MVDDICTVQLFIALSRRQFSFLLLLSPWFLELLISLSSISPFYRRIQSTGNSAESHGVSPTEGQMENVELHNVSHPGLLPEGVEIGKMTPELDRAS